MAENNLVKYEIGVTEVKSGVELKVPYKKTLLAKIRDNKVIKWNKDKKVWNIKEQKQIIDDVLSDLNLYLSELTNEQVSIIEFIDSNYEDAVVKNAFTKADTAYKGDIVLLTNSFMVQFTGFYEKNSKNYFVVHELDKFDSEKIASINEGNNLMIVYKDTDTEKSVGTIKEVESSALDEIAAM